MKLYFSHGRKSDITDKRLFPLVNIAAAFGFVCEILDYTHLYCPEERVNYLKEILQNTPEPYALVGVSMGGYVSLVCDEMCESKGLFLIAPSVYMSGYERQLFEITKDKPLYVVHGWLDQKVPVENAIRFAQKHECDLYLRRDNHQFEYEFAKVEHYFRFFLREISS